MNRTVVESYQYVPVQALPYGSSSRYSSTIPPRLYYVYCCFCLVWGYLQSPHCTKRGRVGILEGQEGGGRYRLWAAFLTSEETPQPPAGRGKRYARVAWLSNSKRRATPAHRPPRVKTMNYGIEYLYKY